MAANALIRFVSFIVAIAILSSCGIAPQPPVDPRNTEVFKVPVKDKVTFADIDELTKFENETDIIYRLGEGDKINVTVWNRPELSGRHIVGPDGHVSIPLIGSQNIATMTREEAAKNISHNLDRYYKKPIVDIDVEEYKSNRVTVLGRVLTPGTLAFDRPPMLLDVLARSGSLPVLDKQATLTRCAIFRGRDKVIWVDLKRLINNGDLAYNIRLKANDLVYIPDSSDTTVYVMGYVTRPGAYRLTPGMTYLDALAQAGGPLMGANTDKIGLYRQSKDAVQRIPFDNLMTEGKSVNVGLEEGDIIYVPMSTIAEVGYFVQQLMPGLGFLTFGYVAGFIKP